jgi:hypothetical protein
MAVGCRCRPPEGIGRDSLPPGAGVPLVALPIVLPADLAEVRSGDVDGDGRDELILVSRKPMDAGRTPDAVSLTVVRFGPDGRELGRRAVDLGQRPVLWDVQGGLWGIDGQGATNLLTGQRVVEQATLLAGLGLTTPMAVDLAHDLEGDGKAELFLPIRGGYAVEGVDGRSWGELHATGEGSMRGRSVGGGMQLDVGRTMPTLAVADVDGDNRQDPVLFDGDRALTWKSGEGSLTGPTRQSLPFNLDPRDDPGRTVVKGEVRREVADAWLQDVDGDGRADLGLHQWVLDGSWFGSTAEFVSARGGGGTFSAPQVVRTKQAAVQVQRVDYESDGDIDLLVAELDLGVGNLARGLVQRSVRVDVNLYAWTGGVYAIEPVLLRRLDFSIEEADQPRIAVEADITGDGIVDLVTDDGLSVLRVYGGSASGFSAAATGEVAVMRHPRGEVAVMDLTGDGTAEVVIWAPGQTKGSIVHWQ